MNRQKQLIRGVLCVCVILFSGCTLMKAEMKFGKKNYEEAIPLLKEYLAENPDSVLMRSKLGFAYMKTGRLDDSVVELKKVLAAKPGEPFAVLNLGLAYVHKKEYGKAIDLWQGYRDKKRPLVEEEIRRQLTLLRIAESQRLAKQAIADEERLKTVEPKSNTIAICYYKDLSRDKSLRAFQKGLAAMVITDLSKITSLTIVERERLQSLLEEMDLGQTGIVDESTAPRTGRLLRARNLVVGSLWTGSIGASTTVIGEKSGTSTVSVPQEKFYELSSLIVQDIANIMGIDLTSEQMKAIAVPHTTSYKALTYFGEALDALDAGNWQEAKDLFQKALKADPKFKLAEGGNDSCPSPGSPSPQDVSADSVTSGIEAAESAQSEADAAAVQITGGGGGDCFTYDTLVLMHDNTFKRIVDLRSGDMVQAYDVASNKKVVKQVTQTYRADQDHYYLINGVLRITGSHQVFIEPDRWVAVSDLKKGCKVRSLGDSVEITSIEKVQYDHRVYNFKVEESHNYFVSAHAKDLYLVHNSK
ncbi:MAG: tetratricopeptide repeat protein [Deltaproteobacteria bacterium]|nr:tetratricopeptide repeat protein [Deltaproteobacteria bacterium]